MSDFKLPCEEIDEYLEKWESDDNGRYVRQDEILKKYFQVLYPKNNNLEEILLKIYLLNDYYTAFYKNEKIKRNTFSVANYVLSIEDIDEMLDNGDIKCVDDITEKTNLYVFATKYCSFHRPDMYPIFDSKVEKVFKRYRGINGFDFNDVDLRKYRSYVTVYNDFKEKFELNGYDYKQIDQYLWLLGRKL